MSSISRRIALGALSWAIVGAAGAATALRPSTPVNVSRTADATEKAKPVRFAYLDGGVLRKAWLLTYADGPAGAQNVYERHSFDDGATWSAPVLLSRDGRGAPTGGVSITARDARSYVADNDKPSVFAPPYKAAPAVVVAWNSAYCPQDPAASGSYVSAVQGVGDFDADGTSDRPFHCVWVATSTDPRLATWNVQPLTDATRDAIGEVLAGNATGTAFTLAWQEDPAGLQPGEAEGRGDGGMGAHVTGGTNIWYAYAATPDGAALRASITQLSDNDTEGTGQPGASRPNLQISGSTAVVAYEESSCPGGTTGKCIVYHAFGAAQPELRSPGTIVSDVTRNARRVRFVLQGATSAGSSALRTVLLWRESVSHAPGAPADIVLRRGLVDTDKRPGSTGFLPADVLADTPQRMTSVAASGGNANAHRAVVRGDFVALAYDLTADMAGADPEKTPVPTAHYDLFLTRSTAGARAGSWSAPANLSALGSSALTVVEPRLVPTPGTLVNPLTGVPDLGDTQNPDVLYVAYATEANTAEHTAGRVYVGRSTDQGASFEPFVPVSARTDGQSEAQLRPSPDGSAALVVWMEEQSPGDVQSKEAMSAVATAVGLPDLAVAAPAASFTAGSPQTLVITLSNDGEGAAHDIVVTAAVPDGLHILGIGDPARCGVQVGRLRCTLADLPAAQSQVFTLTVGSTTEGTYALPVTTQSDDLDADATDNAAVTAVVATAPAVEPPPGPEPGEGGADDGGGGCTMARGPAPFDPVLPALACVALLGLGLGRVRRGAAPAGVQPGPR